MATTVTNPQLSSAIGASLQSGTAPAIATCNINDSFTSQPTVGTSANNVNAVYSASLTLASGSNNDVDLTTLTDPLGNAINFAKITAYKLTNNGTTGQTLTVGAGTNGIIAAAESSEPVQALGSARHESFLDGGLTVDSTHKIFRITAGGGGTVSYTLTIVGHT